MEDNFFEPAFRYKILFNILFLLYLTFKTREFIIDFRKNLSLKRAEENDDHSLISSALEELIKFKRLGKMIAFEACSFYYCFFKWKKNNNEKKYFTGYQNNGITALYLGLMFVSIAEAVTLHYLLISWNRIFAITFLTLHIYLLINLTGHLKAIFFRNHFISDEEIIIRYGLFNTLKIPIDLIEKINKFEGDYEKNNSLVKFALLGKLEPHNVSLKLKDKLEIDLPFGIKKKPINILLYIDNEMEFLKIVNSKIQ
ncbi:hypothetical protein [Flavobacterium mesophilum]|uniref:hypothetical protein n=1 Tax=Flavobacterium mesophilum TaxID=3143495 RepID=UPI0031DF00F5